MQPPRSLTLARALVPVAAMVWLAACPATGSGRRCPVSSMYDPAPPRLHPTWFHRGGRTYGARPDVRGPIGGGPGYRNHVLSPTSTRRVKTLDGLLAALRTATSGSVIFIDGRARLDCTVRVLAEKLVLEIPAGVTLASDRGHRGSPGALIFSDAHVTRPLIRTLGPGVRITGLRLRGPEPHARDPHHRRSFAQKRGRKYYYLNPVSEGIRTSHPRLTVDNCELAGWSYAAILLRAGDRHHIHHNRIHHNLYRGLGYGVALKRAVALIERNLFYRNRHSIAATGAIGSGYEAAHNVDLGRGRSHCFDVHGGSDRGDSTNIAATWLKIHHNTFRYCPRAIAIRGAPQRLAHIQFNWFSHRTVRGAIYTAGNTRIRHNAYDAKHRRLRPRAPSAP